MQAVKRELYSQAVNGLRHLSWKSVLQSVLGAAWRVHRYRDIHTGMLREALCDLDCDRQRRDCIHE